MARIFTEDFYDLPRVDLLDWALWERLEKLIEPHIPPEYGQPLFFASDSRGQYDATNLTALRAEVEQQETPPESIRLTLSSGLRGGYFVNMYVSTVVGTGGRVQSGTRPSSTTSLLGSARFSPFHHRSMRRQPMSVRAATGRWRNARARTSTSTTSRRSWWESRSPSWRG